MPDRDVLHSDINCCYAQIECQARPELRGKPVVVGGDEEARHGIVLAKNLIAKRAGVKTAMALWEARKACPGLVVVPPDYRLYMDVSRRAREIYYDYTDRVEPFGPDEAWLDVTGTRRCLGLSPAEIAREVSERMVAELGISVSVGVSWNKIFAKFGSDYKKPDAVTVITRENYREVVWQAPVRDLLYVGPATERKLHSSGIDTIGQLACASDEAVAQQARQDGVRAARLRARAGRYRGQALRPGRRRRHARDQELRQRAHGPQGHMRPAVRQGVRLDARRERRPAHARGPRQGPHRVGRRKGRGRPLHPIAPAQAAGGHRRDARGSARRLGPPTGA